VILEKKFHGKIFCVTAFSESEVRASMPTSSIFFALHYEVFNALERPGTELKTS
jgi:hypothetical protein